MNYLKKSFLFFLLYLVSCSSSSEQLDLSQCLKNYVYVNEWVKQKNTYFAPDGSGGGVIKIFTKNSERFDRFSSDESFYNFKEIKFDGGIIKVFPLQIHSHIPLSQHRQYYTLGRALNSLILF